MFKLILFILLSIGAVLISGSSSYHLRSHGFYRLFAFECLLALALLNIDVWFSDPFSPMQLVSWLFLLSSLILALHGFYLLGKYGKPDGSIDRTTIFVRRGLYRFIRHPLYTSLLVFGAGVFFKEPSFIAGGLLVCVSVFLFLTAKMEEKLNTTKFGVEYEQYKKSTKMMIPFLF
jgi:protein-S-isoprenylcysteine O-methyltransferase Ste14